jgi:hypothetical protein
MPFSCDLDFLVYRVSSAAREEPTLYEITLSIRTDSAAPPSMTPLRELSPDPLVAHRGEASIHEKNSFE